MDIDYEKKLEKEAKARGEFLGNAYEDHFLALLHNEICGKPLSDVVTDSDSIRLCHGTVQHSHFKGSRHGHAWLEADGKCINIWDGEIHITSSTYAYGIGQIRDVKRYTLKEAAKLASKSWHSGPWE